MSLLGTVDRIAPVELIEAGVYDFLTAGDQVAVV